MGNSGIDNEHPLLAVGIPRLQARDLESVVDRIVRTLRAGKPAYLPGLGTISPGKEWTFLQEHRAQPAPPPARRGGSRREDEAK